MGDFGVGILAGTLEDDLVTFSRRFTFSKSGTLAHHLPACDFKSLPLFSVERLLPLLPPETRAQGRIATSEDAKAKGIPTALTNS